MRSSNKPPEMMQQLVPTSRGLKTWEVLPFNLFNLPESVKVGLLGDGGGSLLAETLEGDADQVLNASGHAVLPAQVAHPLFDLGQRAVERDAFELAAVIGVIIEGDAQLVVRDGLG